MKQRVSKINSFLAQEISAILQKELSLKKGVLISVSKADTSPDLRHSRIFISVLPSQESDYVLATLKKEIFAIQGFLNRKMATKIIPKITFQLDQRPEKIDQIEEIFRQIHREQE